MNVTLLLLILSVLIIIGLAYYAGMLLQRIRRQKQLIKQHAEQQAKSAAEKKQQRNDNICHSIRFIAQATTQKQCNVSEAAIRLTVLLETLLIDKPIDIAQQYPAISELFEKVKEMPTHEQRKLKPVKEIKILDMQREIFEAELETKIIAEAQQLQHFSL